MFWLGGILWLALVGAGFIDGTKNLADARVYLFSGSKDSVVHPGVVKKLKSYYEFYVGGSGSVVANYTFPGVFHPSFIFLFVYLGGWKGSTLPLRTGREGVSFVFQFALWGCSLMVSGGVSPSGTCMDH